MLLNVKPSLNVSHSACLGKFERPLFIKPFTPVSDGLHNCSTYLNVDRYAITSHVVKSETIMAHPRPSDKIKVC